MPTTVNLTWAHRWHELHSRFEVLMRWVCSDDKPAAPMVLIAEQFVPQLVTCAVLSI